MLENLVCSPEMGKKLKAAGWDKPTAFVRTGRTGGEYILVPSSQHRPIGEEQVAAPTAEEALSALPNEIRIGINCYHFRLIKIAKGAWLIYLRNAHDVEDLANVWSESLVEAASDMWLWCKEKGYIK